MRQEGRGEAGQALHLIHKVGLCLAVEQQPHNRLVPVPGSRRQASGSDLPEAQAKIICTQSSISLSPSFYLSYYVYIIRASTE